MVEDQYGRPNKTNRFHVANDINRSSGLQFYWGRPEGPRYDTLAYLPVDLRNRPATLKANPCATYRVTEDAIGGGIKSTWQLFCGVSVGSQTLTGIPHLQRLRQRFGGAIQVWPFESGLVTRRDELPRPILLVEIWPSAMPVDLSLAPVKDAAQVCSVVRACAALDQQGGLGRWLAPQSVRRLPPAQRQHVLDEEGWILGVA